MRRVAIAVLIVLGVTPAFAQAPVESVRVRGDWTFEVFNADGSLAERRDFQNAFFGQNTVGEALVGHKVMGGWSVGLLSPSVEANPFADTGFITTLRDSRGPGTGVRDILDVGCCNPIRLTGNITAMKAGTIHQVYTMVAQCQNDRTPLQCLANPGPSNQFTYTELTNNGVPAPVQLQPDQMLRVTVRFSFFSAPHPPSF